MAATEVGVGFVRLLPSMRGFSAEAAKGLAKALEGPARQSGKDAGTELSKGISSGLESNRAKFRSAAGQVGDTVSQALGDAGDDAGGKLGSGIADGVESQKGRFRSAAGRVGDVFSRALRSGGEDGGKSLADGIASGLKTSKAKLQSAADGVTDLFKKSMVTAGLAGGVLFATGFSAELENEDATARFIAQLGGSEWAEQSAETAATIYGNNYGDTLADVLEATRQISLSGLLPEDATQAQLEGLTVQALTFTDVFETDLPLAMQAVQNMVRTGLVPDAQAGFDVLTSGMQKTNVPAEDLLETYREYSVQFAAMGLSGEQAFGLMNQLVGAGARDIDLAADAIKEFTIRSKDGEQATATAFESLNLNAEEMFARFAKGGPSAKAALVDTIDALKDLDDQQVLNEVTTGLFGTQSEDLQKALLAIDPAAAIDSLGNVKGSTDDLGSAYDTTASKIETFKRQSLQKLTDFFGGTIIPMLEEAGPKLLEAFAPLGPALADLAPVLIDAFIGLGPVLLNVVESAIPVIETIAELLSTFADANPETQKMIVGAIGITGALGPIVRIGGRVASIVGGTARGLATFARGSAKVIRSSIRMGKALGRASTAFIRLGIQAGKAAAKVVLAGVRMATSALKTAAKVVAQIGLQIGKWILLGLQSLLAAAKVALAWIISMGPIGLIIAAVIALVALIIANWDTIVEVTKALGQKIADIFNAAIDWVKQNWPLILAIITGPIGLAVLAIVKNWDTIKEAFSAVKDWIRDRINDIVSFFVALPGRIRSFIDDAWSFLKTGISLAKDFVKEKIDGVVDFFRNLPGRLTSAMSGLANALKSPFTTAFDAIKRLWNRTVGGFSFNIPDWVPGVGGKGFSIPKMHGGGIFDSGQGEGLALLEDGEGVFSQEQMAALGASTAPGPVSSLEVRISADGDARYKEWIRHMIRVEGGGNVQAALGAR